MYRFDAYILDEKEHALRHDDRVIALRPKTFETLLYLVQRHGSLVRKADLLESLWAGVFVSEGTVAHCVEEIREALGDDAHHPRFIQTIPRVGYRFIALVEQTGPEEGVEEELEEEEYSAVHVTVTEKTSAEGSIETVADRDAPAIRERSLPRKKTVLITVAAGAILIAGIAYLLFRSLGAREPQVNSLVVLPFTNLSGSSDQEYFSDGLTDALTTDLARLGNLRVISRTSAMCYKGVRKPLGDISSELHADVVVEGSVLRSGDRVRITAQLIDPAADQLLWAETYERDMADVLTLLRTMTGTIARRIQLELTRNQRIHLASADPVDPPSYEAYLMGRYHWNKRTLEGFRKGIEYFERALVLRPEYAAAHAGLADCYNMLGDYDILAPEESFRVAQSSARKAIALDEGLAEAHASLAFALMHYDWNWEEVEKEYLRAIALNPNYATAHHWYALYLTTRKRFDEAAEEMNKAKALDPLSLIIITNTGWLRYFMRDYDAAATLYNEGLQMDADFLSAHTKLAWAYEEQKKYRNAIDELQKSLSISAGDRALELMLARAYALSGDKGKARAILTRIEKESRKTYVSPYYVALAYAGLHDSDRAFGWLQEAARERNSWLIWLAVDPRLDALRTDPRFDELVRRVGLEAVRQGGEGSWVRGQGEGSRQ